MRESAGPDLLLHFGDTNQSASVDYPLRTGPSSQHQCFGGLLGCIEIASQRIGIWDCYFFLVLHPLSGTLSQVRKGGGIDPPSHLDFSAEKSFMPTDRSTATALLVANGDRYVPQRSPRGFLVHNQQVFDWMNQAGSERSRVELLYREAASRQVFSLEIQHQMVVTSTAGEIEAMHTNRWVTDSIHLLALLTPSQRVDVLSILVQFYRSPKERQAALEVISNPSRYRDAKDPSIGVAHLFRWNPEDAHQSIQRDPSWHNHQRLESHGLALGALCRGLRQHRHQLSPQQTSAWCEAISMLAIYLVAIDFPTAPSAGPWEETPLQGGLSWDTEAIRAGLAALREWVGGPDCPQLIALKAAARKIAAEAGRNDLEMILHDVETLDLWIDAGATQVRKRVALREEAPGLRSSDAASAFLAQSDLEWKVTEDPQENRLAVATAYAQWLDQLYENLVRPSGMLRYEPFSIDPAKPKNLRDSYLAMNYWLNLDLDGNPAPQIESVREAFGSSDASDPKVLEARNRLAVEGREAEWFLVTELARGYVRQARRLLHSRSQIDLPSGHRESYERWRGRGLECLLRGYGRITPEPVGLDCTSVKSNGYPCPAWGLPEAYEWVRWRGADGALKERVLPGANTSLAWAAVSLSQATHEWLSLPEASS